MLTPVLDAWLALMTEDWGKEDAPWWYNERASLSQFAGAIWKSNGWVLEEYCISRKSHAGKHDGSSRGRCDLMFDFDRLRIVAEAKQVWLAHTNGKNALRAVQTALDAAWSEVARAPDAAGRYKRFGLVFVAPWFRPSIVSMPTEFDTRLRELVRELTTAHPNAVVAWAFPSSKRRLRSRRYSDRRYFPGIVMVLAPHPHA